MAVGGTGTAEGDGSGGDRAGSGDGGHTEGGSCDGWPDPGDEHRVAATVMDPSMGFLFFSSIRLTKTSSPTASVAQD